MKKTLLTLAAVLAAGTMLASCDFSAIPNDGSKATDRRDQGYQDKPINIDPAENNGLYKYAPGYEMGPWNCWDKDGPVAETENGSDGGMRIKQAVRPCGGTYWGVNLAAGSEVGKNADLDGKGYTKVVMKIRGTTPASTIYFFANTSEEGIGDWDGVSADGNGKVWYRLNHYTSEYNETTWTEITVPITYGTSSNKMSSCLTIGGDGGWVELKDIDWQKEDGTSVVPAYASAE